MGFCFCLSSHIRTKHSIFFVFTNVEVIWKQNQFLKAQQAKKFWRPVQPILVAQIPPSSFEIPSHYVHSRVCSSS